jgi:nucleoside-diphosphate-sugar epimerase
MPPAVYGPSHVQHFVQCSTVCTYGIAHDWMPVTEDHPLRPTTAYGQHKAQADAVFLEAYYRQGFPVTILKPSTTYGPKQGLLRQIAWEFSWIDRIRKGKPLLICGDGNALHQHLHVDDAALAFAHIIGKAECIGQVYHLVDRGFITWADYHRTAMRVLGREVELVGVPLADLLVLNVPYAAVCHDVFAHHGYYSAEKLFRDVPQFRPVVSLERGMQEVIDAMDRAGRIPNADLEDWEDHIIAAQRSIRTSLGAD